MLGLLAALEKPLAPKPPPDRGASKPRGDWWRPELIWPILREVATRGCFATAVAGLVDRFPVVYGALAPTTDAGAGCWCWSRAWQCVGSEAVG